MTGACILAPAGARLAPEEWAFFREADPWGFILFTRHAEDADQVRALVTDLRAAVGRHAPVLIDQEGGRVDRLHQIGLERHLPPLDELEASRDPMRSAWIRGRILAHDLAGLGIDVNCTPCCDVAQPDTHPFLRNRCLGTDARAVTARARAMAEGQAAGGVSSVLKHMPGHGRAAVDSHLTVPRTDARRETLEAVDFAPFRALRDMPLGMTGHVIFQAIDDAAPATTSPAMHRVIRDEIGFGGLLMTDDLSMEALDGDVGQRTRAARAAGCDLILHCNGTLAEMETVAAEAGRLDAPAPRAVEPPDPIDIAALRAERAALLEGMRG
ncbi:MAG: glycoside hydrolase family 3 N-terminal domain-containing protein [Shimia sp.]